MKIRRILDKRGEGYIDVCIIVIVIVACLALIMSVTPVLIAKNQLDNFADELVREAEICGRIGSETSSRYLTKCIGCRKCVNGPNGCPVEAISFGADGKVQINQEFTVTLTMTHDIGFGEFGSVPVTLTSKASGKSEVYWK